MKEYFARMFGHSAWANRRTLESLEVCPAVMDEAMPVMAHLLAAEHVWQSRLMGLEPKMAVWPDLSLDECQELADECEQSWQTYLDGLTVGDLDWVVAYHTSKGIPCSDVAADILMHVLTHGGYHRGQIAKMVGRTGGTAASTDYIIYVRMVGQEQT